MKTFDLSQEKVMMDWLTKTFGYEKFVSGLPELKRIIQLENLDQGLGKIVTVAGTNGKGETVHTLNQILIHNGLKTALFTSPHVLSLSERFIFNDQALEQRELLTWLKDCYVWAQARWQRRLSFFEFLFLAFIKKARQKQVDVTLLEVGLGGRLDATNSLDADVMAITSISRDHQKVLGSKFEQILIEKLGIARAHRPMVSTLTSEYLRDKARKYCLQKEVLWQDLLAEGKIAATHSFSERNHILATVLAQKLCQSKQLIIPPKHKNISKGRFEKMTKKGRSFIFIGSHNLDGIRHLTSYLLQGPLSEIDKVIYAPSNREYADYCSILRHLVSCQQIVDKLAVTHFTHTKAMEISTLKRGLMSLVELGQDIDYQNDWKNYLHDPLYQGQTFLFTGSYYFIGVVQSYLLSL